MMKPRYWLALAITSVASAQIMACSSKFGSCEASRTCAADAEGGMFGDAGDDSAGASGSHLGGGASGLSPSAGMAGTTEGGAAGDSSSPQCGTPGAACCEGGLCVAHATCSAAMCGCSGSYSACGDECVDFKTDPNNCGSCGHNCLGGDCDSGTCQPVDVVSGQPGLEGMITDGTYLYWTGYGTPSSNPPTINYVARRRVDGSDVVKVLAANEVGGTSLALASDKLYWIAGQKLRSCDLPGCATGPTDAIADTVHSSQGYDLLFEPTKKGLYISSHSDYNSTNGAVTLLAAGSSTPAVVGPNSIGASSLVRDAANVYWVATSTYSMDKANANGGLYRTRISDGVVTQLASGLTGDILDLAIGGNALFFSGSIQKPVMVQGIIRAPLPNGLPLGALPTFVDAINVRGMVADDSYLYYAEWSLEGTGTVNRCPVAACPTPEVIAPDAINPTMGAEDAVSIYWKSTTLLPGGATSVVVRRLAK
jgi:hypothetical protein